VPTPLWFRKSESLDVRVEHEWPSLFIRVSGQIDVSNAEVLEQELRGAFHSSSSRILLDLDRVDSVDSTALRVLLGAAKRSRESGNRLRIRCGSQAVRKVIERMGLERALPLTG
jgi:anti-sigma B factor antagonist